MNRRLPSLRVASLALLAISAATSVSAQMRMGTGSNGSAMMGRMMNQDCPMMGMMMPGQEARLDARLAANKTQIGITAAQETAWAAYAGAAKKSVESMQTAHQAMMQTMQGKTPIERLDGHIGAIEGRVNQMKAMKSALSALYETLNGEQKTKANSVLTGPGCGM